MSITFLGKTVLVFSPQPWHFLHISKHHYAVALAKNSKVFFITSPSSGYGLSAEILQVEDNVSLLEYRIPVPSWFKFKFPEVYKRIVSAVLPLLIKKHIGKADFCIDFGCYPLFDSLTLFDATYRIFFPVDDFRHLGPDFRGSNLVLSVSQNIVEKFPKKKCHFINHGLSSSFIDQSKIDLDNNKDWKRGEMMRVGYAGNLFLQFMDTEILQQIITQHPHVEFHFFGSTLFNANDQGQMRWNTFLRTSANVFLHGQVLPNQLVEYYQNMDAFLLCYKPDYLNYHGENSHKILEYLSTGKVVISTHITHYSNKQLLSMPDASKPLEFAEIFHEVITHPEAHNSLDKMNFRRRFALENSYLKNIEKIESMMNYEA